MYFWMTRTNCLLFMLLRYVTISVRGRFVFLSVYFEYVIIFLASTLIKTVLFPSVFWQKLELTTISGPRTDIEPIFSFYGTSNLNEVWLPTALMVVFEVYFTLSMNIIVTHLKSRKREHLIFWGGSVYFFVHVHVYIIFKSMAKL